MPLFNNWPYTDLSKLNLDWIMKKIKYVEEAEADAQKVIDAAAEIIPKVDQVNSDADRAEAAANAAAASATAAAGSATQAADSKTGAANAALAASASETAAASSADRASSARTDAENAATSAEQYKQDAIDARAQALQAATRSETAATRAENAASTTGFTGKSGSITANASADTSLPYGEYILVYKADDDQSSAGLFYLTVTSSGTLPIRKLVSYVGSTGLVLTMNSQNVLHILSTYSATVHWTLLGFNYGS